MAQEEKPLCPACGKEVIAGTLYCWRHAASQTFRVGEFVAEAGQLLWVARGCSVAAEHPLALLVDEQQVVVRDVEELCLGKPARLVVSYTPPGTREDAEPAQVVVPLPELLGRILEGWERIDATAPAS
ncbi:MAG: hypothetical protein FJ125_12370 [Deltaproteobacteria bacterium]|nr:hypothetical protein [Deltaproteobacteria bacterium]